MLFYFQVRAEHSQCVKSGSMVTIVLFRCRSDHIVALLVALDQSFIFSVLNGVCDGVLGVIPVTYKLSLMGQ